MQIVKLNNGVDMSIEGYGKIPVEKYSLEESLNQYKVYGHRGFSR